MSSPAFGFRIFSKEVNPMLTFLLSVLVSVLFAGFLFGLIEGR